MVLVAVVAVIIGLSLASKQSADPILKTLLAQQAEIIKSQNKLDSKMGSGNVGADTNVTGLNFKQQLLEQRVAALETQLKGLQDLIDKVKNQPNNNQPGPPQEDLTKVYDIPVEGSTVIGAKNAPVTIVEFVDFQCPFCSRFHPPVEEVLKTYPDKVNYIIKNYPLPFHPMAKPAAKATLAANEQGKYREMVNAILEDNSNLSEDKFKELAKKIGMNVDKFMKDFKDKDAQWEAVLKKDLALVDKVQVMGTPTFFLNGRKTTARDFGTFKVEIDEVLKK